MCLHWAKHVHYDTGGIAVAFQKQLLLVALFGVPATALAQTPTTADLFDGSVLHEVRITMSTYAWAALKEDYATDAVFIVDTFQWTGAGGMTASVGHFQMHNRGHGSRSPIKPGLHLSFDALVPGQTFLGLSALELKPNTQDASMLHERLSMLLFARMGIPCSREVHSTFYVNGEYIGVYVLVEYPDAAFLTRIFNESTGYEYNYVPGDWTGVVGFGYHFEYLGPDLTKYASVNVPTPFDPESHPNAPDTVTLEGMIRTMNQEPDATFLSAMAPYLDLKLFLRHIAVETYVADFDCILGDYFGMNNFHFYRFVNQQLSQFIPWDKDEAFSATVRPVLQNADQNVLMRRLMAIPEYKQYYFQALVNTATNAMAGNWMQQEATREYNQIQQAAYADSNKLYSDNGYNVSCSNACFDAAAAYVVAFPPLRTQFVMTDIVTQGYQLPSNYPKLTDGGVVSAASCVASPARGGLASIYGSNMGKGDNTTVYINGFPAPVFFASPGQFNVQIPWEVTGMGTFSMIVNGMPSNVQSAGVITYSPDVFVVSPTQAAITHADGTLVSSASPAAANETVVVYATGLGPVSGAMVTGAPASSTSLQAITTTQPATATLGGVPATVSFSGLTPGFIGLYQVNVQVPANTAPGSLLTIAIGGGMAPAVPLPTK
jgi:uncharacterized protein (TIGR03437 family)